jgi:hypothetical protein
VIPGHRDDREAQGGEEFVGVLVLVPSAAMRKVTGGDDQFRLHSLDEPGQRRFNTTVLTCTRMEVGKMEDACRHERMRL